MKLTNQIEDKSLLVKSVERTKLDEIRDDKLNEKRKKIPDDSGQSLALLISQLPPETRELIEKFALLSAQQNAIVEKSNSAQDSAKGSAIPSQRADSSSSSMLNHGASGVSKDLPPQQAAHSIDKLNSLKSARDDKTSPDLDAMMLAAVPTIVAPQQPVAIDAAPSEDEESAKLEVGKRSKGGNDHDDIKNDSDAQTAPVKHVNEQQHLATAQGDKAFANTPAQPIPVPQQQITTPSSNTTQGQQIASRLSSVTQNAHQINRVQDSYNRMSAADISKLSEKSKSADSAHEVSSVDNNKIASDEHHKFKKEEVSDSAQLPQMTVPMPNLQDLVVGQLQQQSAPPSTSKRTAEQEKTFLGGQDKAGSVEGIRYNLNSWGQNQSVQIVGSNQTGYTLRPSDEHVQQVLEQHKDDTLSISIENAPDASGTRSDIDELSIKSVSGNESSR